MTGSGPAPEAQVHDDTGAGSPATVHSILRGTLRAHYVRAVVLLAECQPYVDDPDLLESIDELMADVDRSGSLTCRKNATQWEVALPDGTGR